MSPASKGSVAHAALPPRLFVAAHTSKVYGPVQALTGWLRAQGADFTVVELPFGHSGIPRAAARRFEAGRPAGEIAGHAARGWDPWLWIKDWCFAFRRGWKAGARTPLDLFLGVDCLNASVGLALRALGRTRRAAFYVIDYTPRRFKNPVLNAVYAGVDRLAALRCDEVWNLSERMRDVRRKQGVREDRNRLVPVGVELNAVVPPPRAKLRRHSLLYMGALTGDKGLQLMVEAFPDILRRVPKAELNIFGFGPFEAELKRLVLASPARARIRVPGGLPHEKLFKEAPKHGVALAPYLDDPDSYTWWCDPTKPKEYLACGLPLIITKVPWIWERVADARRPLGLAIDYQRVQLVEACVRLLKDDRFYRRCRGNALAFAAGLDWGKVYERAFAGGGGMTLEPGRFSIIIPVKAYNDYCAESLEACGRLYPDQELLFSPDSPSALPLPGVTVVPSGPVGPGAKRDLCAARAKGEFLAFLDDDAYPAAGWLEAAAEVFGDPTVGAVCGPAVTPPRDSVARWASGLVYESLLVGGPFAFRYRPLKARDCDDYPTCNLLVRRSVFEAIGGFDTRYWPGEDTVACLKIVHELKRRIVYDPRVLVFHHRRDMFRGHLRQLNRYARHRGFFVKRFPKTSLRPSYFAPTVLLAWTVLGWLPGLAWAPWTRLWAGSLAVYSLLALLEAARLSARTAKGLRGPVLWLLTAGGLAATHYSYGWNLMVGLLSARMEEERSAMTGEAT